MCQIHLSLINTIVVSKNIIDPSLSDKKHQTMKIETLTDKKAIITFLKFFENNGTFVADININIRHKIITISKTFSSIKQIIEKVNTKEILVIGCIFAIKLVEGI